MSIFKLIESHVLLLHHGWQLNCFFHLIRTWTVFIYNCFNFWLFSFFNFTCDFIIHYTAPLRLCKFMTLFLYFYVHNIIQLMSVSHQDLPSIFSSIFTFEHTVSQKTAPYTFVHNFDKCWRFFKNFRCCILQDICNKTDATLPITVCTVVQNCCKGDEPCQWNTPIFRPSEIRNPLTDRHETRQEWSRRGYHPTCKLWYFYP